MRRTVAVLVLCLAVLTAACSNGAEQGVKGGGPGATNPDGSPVIADGDGATTTAPPAGGGPGTTQAGSRPGSPSPHGPTTTRPGSPPTTTRAQSPNHPESGARGPVGAFARTLLRPQPATRLVVEVMVEPGFEPRQSALDRLVATLADVSGKPVSLSGPVVLPRGDGTTSAQEIRDMSDRHSATPHTTDRAVLRLLYLGGRFAEEEEVIGVAVRGDTAAVFKEVVQRTGSPFVAPASVIEEAVVVHEVGHILGLVDLVVDTGRDDPEYPGHSPNKASVMYWAVESSLMGQALEGPPSREFDDADRADLARMRNGG